MFSLASSSGIRSEETLKEMGSLEDAETLLERKAFENVPDFGLTGGIQGENFDLISEKSEEKTEPQERENTDLMSEFERLEKEKERLENKLEDIQQKAITVGIGKQRKQTYLLQASHVEKKLEMLEKRISLEKRQMNLALSKWKRVKNVSMVNRGFYSNILKTEDILKRKLKAKSEKLNEEDVKRVSKVKDSEDLGKWGNWRKIVPEEDEEIEVHGRLIFKSTTRITTKFFPPIPDPMAKKRPRSALPLSDREATTLGEETNPRHRKEAIFRLLPNSKRVSYKRATMYARQLEFAEKYGMETKDIIENLNSAVHRYGEILPGEIAPGVTRQQLYLMGALSKDHLHGNDYNK